MHLLHHTAKQKSSPQKQAKITRLNFGTQHSVEIKGDDGHTYQYFIVEHRGRAVQAGVRRDSQEEGFVFSDGMAKVFANSRHGHASRMMSPSEVEIVASHVERFLPSEAREFHLVSLKRKAFEFACAAHQVGVRGYELSRSGVDSVDTKLQVPDGVTEPAVALGLPYLLGRQLSMAS